MIIGLLLAVILSFVMGGVLSLMCYGALYGLDYVFMYAVRKSGSRRLADSRRKRLFVYKIIACIPGLVMACVWIKEIGT